LEDIFGELADLWGKVLFVYQVKSCDEFSEPLVLEIGTLGDISEHLLNMLFSYDFKSSKNQFEIKLWMRFL